MARLIAFRDPITTKKIGQTTFELDLREVIDVSLYFSGTFEEEVERIIDATLKPGMCCLDIGANIGYHTFRMARLVSDSGIIHAIEPTSWAIRRLERNASLNPEYRNIRISRVALGDRNAGLVRLPLQSSYRLDGTNSIQEEEVELVTIDTYIKRNNITHVDFVKLDVDGFEGKIIRGGVNTLLRMKPILLMEINPATIASSGENPEDLVKILTNAGYKFTNIHGSAIESLSNYCIQHANASTMILGVSRILNQEI